MPSLLCITVLPLTLLPPARLAQPAAPHRSPWAVSWHLHASDLPRACACSARGRSNGRCSLRPWCSCCAAWGASCQGAAGDHQVLPPPPPAGKARTPLFCLHACTQGLLLGRCCGALLHWSENKVLPCTAHAHALCGVHDANNPVCHKLPGAPHLSLQRCHGICLPTPGRHCAASTPQQASMPLSGETVPGLCSRGHFHHPVPCSQNLWEQTSSFMAGDM